jgi:hypothetical protein
LASFRTKKNAPFPQGAGFGTADADADKSGACAQPAATKVSERTRAMAAQRDRTSSSPDCSSCWSRSCRKRATISVTASGALRPLRSQQSALARTWAHSIGIDSMLLSSRMTRGSKGERDGERDQLCHLGARRANIRPCNL